MSNFHPEIIKTMAGVSRTPSNQAAQTARAQTDNTNIQSQPALTVIPSKNNSQPPDMLISHCDCQHVSLNILTRGIWQQSGIFYNMKVYFLEKNKGLDSNPIIIVHNIEHTFIHRNGMKLSWGI